MGAWPRTQNPPSHGWEDGPGVRAPGGSGEPGSVHAEGDGFGPRTGAAGADGADAHAEVAADGEAMEHFVDAAFRDGGEGVPEVVGRVRSAGDGLNSVEGQKRSIFEPNV